MANFNFNKAILGGRLTADPELRQTASGISVVSFTVAVSRRVARAADQGGAQAQPTADFINCVAWRQTAEFISRYFRKGSSICVTGQIQTRTWNDQQNVKHYATEVIVDEAMFVDSKGEGPARDAAGGQYGAPAASYTPESYSQFSTPAQPNQAPAADPKFESVGDDDDLPF